MQVHKYRKYPIQHKKATGQESRESISIVSISLSAAAGIMAVVFTGGLVSGWMLKKRT